MTKLITIQYNTVHTYTFGVRTAATFTVLDYMLLLLGTFTSYY